MKDNLRLYAIRGATTSEYNSKDDILNNTRSLLESVLEKNKIDNKNIVSIIFTLTDDLNAVYPAKAARELGIVTAALMCARELPVPDSLEKCIRIMIHCYLPEESQIKHIYLKQARSLRPDLVGKCL